MITATPTLRIRQLSQNLSCSRPLVCSQLLSPKITTQKLYYLNHRLANHLSVLLASSYIYN